MQILQVVRRGAEFAMGIDRAGHGGVFTALTKIGAAPFRASESDSFLDWTRPLSSPVKSGIGEGSSMLLWHLFSGGFRGVSKVSTEPPLLAGPSTKQVLMIG